jgi:hypothetical protein
MSDNSALLEELGARNETEALQTLNRMNTLISACMRSAGVDDEGQLSATIAAHASANDFVAQLTGEKDGEAARGVLLAWQTSHNKLAAVETELTELRTKTGELELETMLRKAKEDKKHTPALETTIREQMAAGALTIAGAQAMINAMPPQPALAAQPQQQPPVSPSHTPAASSDTAEEPWDGKSYNELKPLMRAKLKKDNHALFLTMRANPDQKHNAA